jgi:hypothetical protein
MALNDGAIEVNLGMQDLKVIDLESLISLPSSFFILP